MRVNVVFFLLDDLRKSCSSHMIRTHVLFKMVTPTFFGGIPPNRVIGKLCPFQIKFISLPCLFNNLREKSLDYKSEGLIKSLEFKRELHHYFSY